MTLLLIKGLTLLNTKYGLRDVDVYARHDEVILKVDVFALDSADILELEKLGFNVDYSEELIKYYV